MIKLEHVVEPSYDQMIFVVEGMRNPMNSWDKDDCGLDYDYMDEEDVFILGRKNKTLMKKLAKAGTDHRKFMRMMPVMARITAPLYWWKEFDTYKVGTVANSCSTMHKITEKEFELDDFSHEHLDHLSLRLLEDVIVKLNANRNEYLEYTKDDDTDRTKKDYWWQLIQLLPSSYNQTRNVMLNYEVLYNMYHARKNHKLDEWREFCKWIETLEFSFLITGEDILKEGLQEGLQPGA